MKPLVIYHNYLAIVGRLHGESFHSKANAERVATTEASLYGQNAVVLLKAKVGYARREST